MTRDAPREIPFRILGQAIVKVKNTLSSTIEYAPLPCKFSQPRFKYFYGDTDSDYHILHYWFSELSTRLIDFFKNLVNIFTNTYLVYHDVQKRHKAIFIMVAQSKDKILMAYLKRFHVKLAEVERLDDILAIMAYKQGLYVNSLFSQKLNKRKYDYATLAECMTSLTGMTKPKGIFLIRSQ